MARRVGVEDEEQSAVSQRNNGWRAVEWVAFPDHAASPGAAAACESTLLPGNGCGAPLRPAAPIGPTTRCVRLCATASPRVPVVAPRYRSPTTRPRLVPVERALSA